MEISWSVWLAMLAAVATLAVREVVPSAWRGMKAVWTKAGGWLRARETALASDVQVLAQHLRALELRLEALEGGTATPASSAPAGSISLVNTSGGLSAPPSGS